MKPKFLNNLGLKSVSLLLGIVLWYLVSGQQAAEIVLDVPLELRNVPEGLEVVAESVQRAEVRLRGGAELLRTLSPQNVQAYLDLTDAEQGEQNLFLSTENVTVPFGVRIMRVTPGSVQLGLDDASTKRVQVAPRVVGAPAEGFELAHIWINPNQVELNGPASKLEGVDKVTTEVISVEGLREPYTQSVRVVVDDPYLRLVEARSVDVTLDVREEQVQRELTGVVLESQPPAIVARLSVQSVTTTVLGPRSLVEQLRVEDIMAVVDLTGLAKGNHEVEPTLSCRRPGFEEVLFVSTEPIAVSVRVLETESSRRQ